MSGAIALCVMMLQCVCWGVLRSQLIWLSPRCPRIKKAPPPCEMKGLGVLLLVKRLVQSVHDVGQLNSCGPIPLVKVS